MPLPAAGAPGGDSEFRRGAALDFVYRYSTSLDSDAMSRRREFRRVDDSRGVHDFLRRRVVDAFPD